MIISIFIDIAVVKGASPTIHNTKGRRDVILHIRKYKNFGRALETQYHVLITQKTFS